MPMLTNLLCPVDLAKSQQKIKEKETDMVAIL
jgi:hypothetical protein